MAKIQPGNTIHAEHYEAPPIGALYWISVVTKRSGGYMGVARQVETGAEWFVGAGVNRGYKTIAGAIKGAQATARSMEDVTYREEVDG